MKHEELIDSLEYLAACFPSQFKLTQRVEAAFATEFGEETVDDMQRAIRSFNKHSNSKFPPTVPQLHEQLRIVKRADIPERQAPALPEVASDTKEDRAAVIESQREKLKRLYNEPIPRIEHDDEIVAGSDDQRFVLRSEVK